MPQSSTDRNGKKALDLKGLGVAITIAIMIVGIIGQWYNSQAAISELQEDYAKLEHHFTEYREKTDDRIMQMKIDITSSSTDIATIKTDIREIKEDIKTLLTRPH